MTPEPLLLSGGLRNRLASLVGGVESEGDGQTIAAEAVVFIASTPCPPCRDLQIQIGLHGMRALRIVHGSLILVRSQSGRSCIAQAVADDHTGDASTLINSLVADGDQQHGEQLVALVSPLLAFNLGLATWLRPFLRGHSSDDNVGPCSSSSGLSTGCNAVSLCRLHWADIVSPRQSPPAAARSIRLVKVGCPQPQLLQRLYNDNEGGASKGAGQGMPGLGNGAGSLRHGEGEGDSISRPLGKSEGVSGRGRDDSGRLLVQVLERYFKQCTR